MRIDQLNAEFGKGDALHFVSGHGNLPKAVLRHPSGASCEVYMYGAHITSWRSSTGDELLFMSSKAEFIEGKPIRGGIPMVFPQFGGGPLPSHGFARIHSWSIAETAVSPSEVRIRLELRPNPAIQTLWKFDFHCAFDIRLTSALQTDFSCTNRGREAFSVQHALHTYFAVQDINHVIVHDLHGLSYLDSLKNRERFIEDREDIRIDGEIDRIYVNAPAAIRLTDSKAQRTLQISRSHMPDAVVWNPWVRRCKEIADLGDHDFERFMCVESGTVGTPVTITANSEWHCSQSIAVV